MKNPISKFLYGRVAAADFPSAVYLVAEKGEIVLTDALGWAVVEPEKIEAKLDTIYDLASLTKPLVTGLLCAKLVENKELDLGRTIDFYLPQFEASDSSEGGQWGVSIGELLAHKSCFPAWKPFYLFAENRAEVLPEIVKTRLNFDQPHVTYSDLNFLILTFLLENIYGERIDEAAKKEIFVPLDLQNAFFNPPPELQKRIAASEFGNEYEKQTSGEMFPEISLPPAAFRDYQIWGEVHDGNCWFMDGVSGHAGLFADVFDAFKIAQQFLAGETTLLKPETCALFRTNFTEGLNEARSIAFELAATKDSTAGGALSKTSFGHLGFTGTSLWIDPENERIFILLTNRTHARALPFVNINSVRREFHALAVEFLDKG